MSTLQNDVIAEDAKEREEEKQSSLFEYLHAKIVKHPHSFLTRSEAEWRDKFRDIE